jgi:twitching motility protein PilT
MESCEFLRHAVLHQASDLHLSTGGVPLIRVDGELQPIVGSAVIDDAEMNAILNLLLTDKQRELLVQQKELDCAINLPKLGRLRVNIFYQIRGISAAIRIISNTVPSFAALGFSEIFKNICLLPHGLVLVVGSTGSGKTTTLAAMVDHINHTQAMHILTIEDPIEYVFVSDKSLVQQRELGVHTLSFEKAVRCALREDPDCILIGELRDLGTARLALTAAETGHLVFATLHTNSAPEAINRIIDIFPSSEKAMARTILASSLQAVIAQELVRKKGGGRVAVQEIMLCNVAVRNMIREDKIQQVTSYMQVGRAEGMRTTQQHLRELIAQGVIGAKADTVS